MISFNFPIFQLLFGQFGNDHVVFGTEPKQLPRRFGGVTSPLRLVPLKLAAVSCFRGRAATPQLLRFSVGANAILRRVIPHRPRPKAGRYTPAVRTVR